MQYVHGMHAGKNVIMTNESIDLTSLRVDRNHGAAAAARGPFQLLGVAAS